MKEETFIEYVKNRKWFCMCCRTLADQVIRSGLRAVNEYDGMICGGVEDIQLEAAKYRGGIND